jgi:hypothetical protein
VVIISQISYRLFKQVRIGCWGRSVKEAQGCTWLLNNQGKFITVPSGLVYIIIEVGEKKKFTKYNSLVLSFEYTLAWLQNM